MVNRPWIIGPAFALLFGFGLASCAAPSGLPEGPTPIPTLIPVTEEAGLSVSTTAPSFTILSYPVEPPSAENGQRIFSANCAECHGEDGAGAIPGSRNFQDLDYMRGEDPAHFYAAVTEGRGIMPAFGDILSSDERWDAVFYVWRHSTTADVLELGKELFESNCASCHGEDGSGELLGSADFTDIRQMDKLAPRDLYLTVTQGRGSMPAWQSSLSQENRWAIIDYLRTFTYDPDLSQEIGIEQAAGPEQPPIEEACPPEQTNPFAWDDEGAIQAGQEIFLTQCALCHGPDGSGGLPDTPDFTSAEAYTEIIEDPGSHLCTISEGEGVMPAFGEALTQQELWQALTYISSLGEPSE